MAKFYSRTLTVSEARSKGFTAEEIRAAKALIASGRDPSIVGLPLIALSTTGGMSTRKAREKAIGGICPSFGLDFFVVAPDGHQIHHPADCGKDRDGHFASVGHRSHVVGGVKEPGTGFEGHLEWTSYPRAK